MIASDRLHHRQPDRQVRDEVVVHHVHVQGVRTRDGLDRGLQVREVRRQQAGHDPVGHAGDPSGPVRGVRRRQPPNGQRQPARSTFARVCDASTAAYVVARLPRLFRPETPGSCPAVMACANSVRLPARSVRSSARQLEGLQDPPTTHRDQVRAPALRAVAATGPPHLTAGEVHPPLPRPRGLRAAAHPAGPVGGDHVLAAVDQRHPLRRSGEQRPLRIPGATADGGDLTAEHVPQQIEVVDGHVHEQRLGQGVVRSGDPLPAGELAEVDLDGMQVAQITVGDHLPNGLHRREEPVVLADRDDPLLLVGQRDQALGLRHARGERLLDQHVPSAPQRGLSGRHVSHQAGGDQDRFGVGGVDRLLDGAEAAVGGGDPGGDGELAGPGEDVGRADHLDLRHSGDDGDRPVPSETA